MELSNILKFNEEFPNFNINTLNNIEIANSVYHIFYNTKENVEIKFPEKHQRYVVLKKHILEAQQIKIENILIVIKKDKLDKLIKIYIAKYWSNFILTFNSKFSLQFILEEIENQEGKNKSPMNQEDLIKFKQIIINIISEINNYLNANNIKIK